MLGIGGWVLLSLVEKSLVEYSLRRFVSSLVYGFIVLTPAAWLTFTIRLTLVGAGGLSAANAVASQSLAIAAVSAEKQGSGSVCTSGGGPGLQNHPVTPAPADATSIPFPPSVVETASGPGVLASCLALLAEKSPDLALIVERWDTLPESIRRAMLALVESGGGKGGTP
jgi:hypothetical protein